MQQSLRPIVETLLTAQLQGVRSVLEAARCKCIKQGVAAIMKDSDGNIVLSAVPVLGGRWAVRMTESTIDLCVSAGKLAGHLD